MSSENFLFHIFTVKPVVVKCNELPRVQYSDYYLFATSLQAAWETIRNWDGVADSESAWGIKLDQHFQITPDSVLNQQQLSSQYNHWAQVQDRYRLIDSGPQLLNKQAVA